MLGRRRAGLVAADGENGLQLTAVGEGVGADEHLDDETAQTPDIGFLGVGRLPHDFGCHPVDTALQGRTVDMAAAAAACSGAEDMRGLDTFRDTEIGDLHATLVVDEDVGSLDISMNDVAAVQI